MCIPSILLLHMCVIACWVHVGAVAVIDELAYNVHTLFVWMWYYDELYREGEIFKSLFWGGRHDETTVTKKRQTLIKA